MKDIKDLKDDRRDLTESGLSEKENEKSAQLQMRLELSISMIVAVALVGFLLFRREAVTLEIYLTIVGVAFLIGLLLILYTLGLWDWIQSNLNVAF